MRALIPLVDHAENQPHHPGLAVVSRVATRWLEIPSSD